ncbi:MAG: hypothetical protein KJO26_00955 [Deltaproteobacteria bacterium]|nr:hypothetical protein [Deltaproteobacteria bacterium]
MPTYANLNYYDKSIELKKKGLRRWDVLITFAQVFLILPNTDPEQGVSSAA